MPEDRCVPINDGNFLLHLECIVRQVVGSVAHQEGRCSCHGGDGTDDPRLTQRESARRAFEMFERRRGGGR